MKIKKYFVFALMTLGVLLGAKLLKAAPGTSCANCTNVDNIQLDRNGLYDSSGAQQFQSGSSTFTALIDQVLVSPRKYYYGAPGVAVSTAITSGLSQGSIFGAYLQAGSGSAAVEGNVLIAAPSVGTNGVTVQVASATFNLNSVVGIAAAAASTGSVVNVFDRGWVLALTTGTVNQGDMLTTSALSAGYLQTTATSSSTIVGVALQAGVAAGGLTRIKLR